MILLMEGKDRKPNETNNGSVSSLLNIWVLSSCSSRVSLKSCLNMHEAAEVFYLWVPMVLIACPFEELRM